MTKTIFKGGYPTPKLNGMSTCNCGAHIEINNKLYEMMNSEVSGHRIGIISKYIRTGTGKVEISIWKNGDEFEYGCAYYNSAESTHSFRYTQNISKVYTPYKNELISVYNELFSLS